VYTTVSGLPLSSVFGGGYWNIKLSGGIGGGYFTTNPVAYTEDIFLVEDSRDNPEYASQNSNWVKFWKIYKKSTGELIPNLHMQLLVNRYAIRIGNYTDLNNSINYILEGGPNIYNILGGNQIVLTFLGIDTMYTISPATTAPVYTTNPATTAPTVPATPAPGTTISGIPLSSVFGGGYWNIKLSYLTNDYFTTYPAPYTEDIFLVEDSRDNPEYAGHVSFWEKFWKIYKKSTGELIPNLSMKMHTLLPGGDRPLAIRVGNYTDLNNSNDYMLGGGPTTYTWGRYEWVIKIVLNWIGP
jgi:hypothetical protein